MTTGISQKSKDLRRQLLNHNGRDVADRMQQSGLAADEFDKAQRSVNVNCHLYADCWCSIIARIFSRVNSLLEFSSPSVTIPRTTNPGR